MAFTKTGRRYYRIHSEMKIIRNNIIPFSGYKAMNLFGVLFVRGNARIDEVTVNHERIHSAQFVEVTVASLAILGVLSLFLNNWLFLLSPFMFYILYVLEWLVRLIQYKGTYMAYRNTSFEREAYQNQEDLYYLKGRKFFSFLKYL